MKTKMKAPGDDDYILSFYEGYFQSAFIAFQPFFKIINKKILKLMEKKWPEKTKLVRYTQPLRWKEIMKRCGIGSYKSVNKRLLESIHAIKIENEVILQQFIDKLDEGQIISPNEGCFNEFLFDNFIDIFKDLQYEYFVISDEWGDETFKLNLSSAKKSDLPFSAGIKNAYSPDYKLLFTIHWDSFFAIFCGADHVVRNSVKKFNLEGFFCGKDTKIHWE
jgi:Protein of unknown function (DUF2711)